MSLFACFGSRKREPRRPIDTWDCSNLGLSDLPKEVLHYRRTLRILTLTCNNIKDVPKNLFIFEMLTELDLSENVILFLPPSIRALRSLTHLNISKNSLSTIPDSIRECQDLIRLDISANSLGSLPEGLTELRQLRVLCLNDCQLEELPPNIGKLSKLEILELRENLIGSLPQSICHLTLLEKLDLGVNEMESLSSVIGTLESLSELWLDGNLLNTLPDEIGSLRNLKFLEVSENQLMFLPLSISFLISLQDLHLSDNLLTLLPETMGELRNLTLLKVERNRLTALPQTIAGWTNLVELSALQNFLEELPAGIGALQRLENLNLDENGLFSLPAELGRLSQLTILSLRSNNLMELPREIGELENLSVLNVAGNRLQFLPYSVTSLKKLTAVWIAENQNRPLLELQLTRSGDGEKMITCILLPQHSSDSPFSQDSDSPAPQRKPHTTAVNFDPQVQDHKSGLTRDPTPYPKELHIKALQWRAAREEAAGGTAVDRAGVTSDVPLRSSGRTRSVHRPYSLIRAMSDPIEPDLASPTATYPPGIRRRDHSRERKEYSRSPGPNPSHSAAGVPGVQGGGSERKGERGSSLCSSPSPPPLMQPHINYSPDTRRGRGEEGRLVRVQPNGTRATNYLPTLSPTHVSPGDDYRTALIANSNSNNGNRFAAVPVWRVAAKSSTFPLTQVARSTTTTTTAIPPSAPSQRMHLQPNAQGQSEASTLSHSDIPDPRCSSSMESGFDADVEPDPAMYWYITDSLKHNGKLGSSRQRHASDSSARPRVADASQRGRRGSSDDYDHLKHSGYPARNSYRKYIVPLTNRGSHAHPPSAVYHQKASRSLDNTELSSYSQPTTDKSPDIHPSQQVRHPTGTGGESNCRARSRSQPEDPVQMYPSTQHGGSITQPPRNLHSPSPLDDAPVSPSAIADAKYHHQRELGGSERRRGGREKEEGCGAHQRCPSDSYYASDDSHGLGADSSKQHTPKKTYGPGAWGTSQDSGFDSMPSVGNIIKVELTRDPLLGLGIRGYDDEDETVKPANQGYRVYKIVEGSPADRCGKIKLGDKLMDINGVDVSSIDLPDIIALLETETRIALTLYRETSMTLL
jgi:Leucine-rich repeat (LRR) protein